MRSFSTFALVALLLLPKIAVSQDEKQLIKDAAKYLYVPSDKAGQEGLDGIINYGKKGALGSVANPQDQGAGKDSGRTDSESRVASADRKVCGKCGRSFPADYLFCPYDATALSISQGPVGGGPVAATGSSGQIWREPVTGMEFIWVPGGCYQMGCGDWTADCESDEKPVHDVCVDGFWIGKYEVTQGQYRQVMGVNPSKFGKGDSYPVETVSWLDATHFTKELTSLNGGKYTFRLPREAEWEYACRSGGRPERYAGGNNVERAAWYSGNSGGSTHPIGGKEPNGLGIYDMSGNVWEWCEDIYGESAYREHARNNPVYGGGGSDRVIRGGSWFRLPRCVRCAIRHGDAPGFRDGFLGFRLLRTN
jgi:formylglycine-generating enzyme required for sulfatase activity